MTIAPATVCGLQFDLVWEDPDANRVKADALLELSPPSPGSLVVLPEMFTSGFTMNAGAVAEPPDGPTERWLTRTARRFGITLVAGWVRSGPGFARPANEALAAGPDGRVSAVYRKQRPFTPGGEAAAYAAGHEGRTFFWHGLTVALFICYDLRFPELFRKVAAQSRPELYVVIASWPDKRTSHWIRLLQARAIENQAYVLGVNRVGSDPVHRYEGRSVLVHPGGEVLVDAGSAEGLFRGELDPDELIAYRTKLPFLDDLRFPC